MKCSCICHNFPEGTIMHIVACCNSNPLCQYSYCEKVADRIVCWDSNQYENDKYGWFCEEHAEKVEEK